MAKTSSENSNSGLAVLIASLIFLGIISLLWAILTYFPSFTGAIEPKETALADLGNTIVVFSFAALALQSSLGIFVSNWRGNDSKIKNRRVNNLKEEIAEIKSIINPTPVLTAEQTSAASPTSSTQPAPTATLVRQVPLSPEEIALKEEKLANLKQLLEQAEDDLAKYREETKAVVSRLSLLAGILISLAGVRILQSFADITLEGKQLSLLNTIDVLLTGGLLAGGSEGVYRLTKVYENVTDVSKKVNK